MIIPRQNFARIATFTYLYSEGCWRGYEDFLKFSAVANAARESEYDPSIDEAERRRDISGLQTIIFSAMCFEAAIYEYAADHLGDEYVKQHLDKLDLLSKWVLIPRVVAGYQIRKDRAPYAALKSLIAARNAIVHSKSEPIDFQGLGSQLARLNEESERLTESVHNAFRALLLMSMELDSALGVAGNPLPCFNPENSPLLEVPDCVKPTFENCRKIIKSLNDERH